MTDERSTEHERLAGVVRTEAKALRGLAKRARPTVVRDTMVTAATTLDRAADLLATPPDSGTGLRDAVGKLLDTPPSIENHARDSMKRCRKSAASSQEFVREDRDDWRAYHAAKDALTTALASTVQRPEPQPGKEQASAFVQECQRKVSHGEELTLHEAGGLIELAYGNPHVYRVPRPEPPAPGLCPHGNERGTCTDEACSLRRLDGTERHDGA